MALPARLGRRGGGLKVTHLGAGAPLGAQASCAGARPARSALGWWVSAAALAAGPKCAVCLCAYAALLTGARVELCGAPESNGNLLPAVAGAVVLLGSGLMLLRMRPWRSPATMSVPKPRGGDPGYR